MTKTSLTATLLTAALVAFSGCDDSGGAADMAASADSMSDAAGADAASPDSASADGSIADSKPSPDSPGGDSKPPADMKAPPDSAPDQALALDGAISCAALVKAFSVARAEAKSCEIGKAQCTTKVIGTVYPGCPCPTTVNGAKTAAIAKMTALRAQFVAAKCTGPVCKCAQIKSVSCEVPSGSTASECVDKY